MKILVQNFDINNLDANVKIYYKPYNSYISCAGCYSKDFIYANYNSIYSYSHYNIYGRGDISDRIRKTMHLFFACKQCNIVSSLVPILREVTLTYYIEVEWNNIFIESNELLPITI